LSAKWPFSKTRFPQKFCIHYYPSRPNHTHHSIDAFY
jgi:hypothetical protein